MATIEISDAVKARIDAIVQDAIEQERTNGEPNGMTDYSGALDWAIDMATESVPATASVFA